MKKRVLIILFAVLILCLSQVIGANQYVQAKTFPVVYHYPQKDSDILLVQQNVITISKKPVTTYVINEDQEPPRTITKQTAVKNIANLYKNNSVAVAANNDKSNSNCVTTKLYKIKAGSEYAYASEYRRTCNTANNHYNTNRRFISTSERLFYEKQYD